MANPALTPAVMALLVGLATGWLICSLIWRPRYRALTEKYEGLMRRHHRRGSDLEYERDELLDELERLRRRDKIRI